jgi:transposase-like protein
MTTSEEEQQLRLEVARLRPDKRRRYGDDLRERILAWVDRSVSEGQFESDCARALGIKTWRFVSWRRRAMQRDAALESITLVQVETPSAASGLVVVTPAGYRIEGLRFEDIAALMRELA